MSGTVKSAQLARTTGEVGRLGMAETLADPTSQQAFGYYPRLSRVAAFCLANFGDIITLADAAAVAHLDPTYFCRYFRDRVGLTFTQWLRQLRVRHAAKLLAEEDFAVSEVAQRSGFRNATVPRMARSTPLANASSIAAIVRKPPPSSTGTVPACSTIR